MRPAAFLLLLLLQAANATDLTLVSFNIRNGGRRMDGTYDHLLQIQVLKDLQPDIVALQEVDHFTRRSGNLDIAGSYASALGMTHHYASALPYDGGGYGGALLSRLPVSHDESVHLPVKNSEPRVCVIRFVQLPDAGTLAIAGVHLDSSETDDTARRENVRILLARFQHISDPLVVLGDFNDQPGSPTLQLFTDAGFQRLTPQGNPASFPADHPQAAIDHIFIKPSPQISIQDLGTRIVPIPNASDHRPLQAKLRVVKKG